MQRFIPLPKLKIEAQRPHPNAEFSPAKPECAAKSTDCATKPSLRIKDMQWLNLYKAIDLAG